MTTLEAGTYSHGTLRDEDLRDMFDTIRSITECDKCGSILSDLDDGLEDSTKGLFVQDLISESINDLFDHVGDTHTPEGHYFGSHPGDGSDFGVWGEESE